MMHLEGIGEFGDVRRAERGAWLFERIVSTGSLVVRKVGGDRAGEMAARRFPGFDDKIISMYARGMSTREIVGHLRDLYGIEVSPDLISAVTDACFRRSPPGKPARWKQFIR